MSTMRNKHNVRFGVPMPVIGPIGIISVVVGVVGVVGVIGACKSTPDGHERPTVLPSEAPKAVASAREAPRVPPPSTTTPPAASSTAAEEPLAWGTRPAQKGPLYPIVDGMCIHGEIWPVKDGVIYTYGNSTGPWSRGGEVTMARFVDDGRDTSESMTKVSSGEAWRETAPASVQGTWPSPLILYSQDTSGGRTNDWTTIWTHTSTGWTQLASHRNEPGRPTYKHAVLFRGHVITERHLYEASTDAERNAAVFKAIPLEKGAAPIANVGQLARPKMSTQYAAANDNSIFLLGWEDVGDKMRPLLRVFTDGKAREVVAPADARFVATRPSLVISSGEMKLFRLEEKANTTAGLTLTLAPIDTHLPPNTKLASVTVAPNGDIWMLPSTRKSVLISRKDRPGTVDELPIPPPSAPAPKEAVMHWPISGASLGGVDLDDPYVIGEGGALYHLESGKWKEVELPTPPFASSGKYQAQSVAVVSKGDVYVNAGYAERGLGWTAVERYRAVLRTKRPKEVLRCNEPPGVSYGSGRGFMSFPPIAQEATCTTPFVILLRLGYELTKKNPVTNVSEAVFVSDPKTDYPAIRELIKVTGPSLGSSVDLVEFISGEQRYVGARVANVASGRELALATVKKLPLPAEAKRPEIVCGQPKAERTIHVDVATGKVTN